MNNISKIEKISKNVLHGRSALKELNYVALLNLTSYEKKLIEKIVKLDKDFNHCNFQFDDIRGNVSLYNKIQKIKQGKYDEEMLKHVLRVWLNPYCILTASLTKIVGELYYQHKHLLRGNYEI